MSRDYSFTRGIAHLANFMNQGNVIPPDAEIVFKFKTQRQALQFENDLKAARMPGGGPVAFANETPHKDRFTFLGVSIKVQHPDVMPYAPMMKKGEKA